MFRYSSNKESNAAVVVDALARRDVEIARQLPSDLMTKKTDKYLADGKHSVNSAAIRRINGLGIAVDVMQQHSQHDKRLRHQRPPCLLVQEPRKRVGGMCALEIIVFTARSENGRSTQQSTSPTEAGWAQGRSGPACQGLTID